MPREKPYQDTLNLPRTDFAMRANLARNEPERLRRWQEMDLYGRLRAARKGRPRFVLHDGPPYANGSIHIGHAVNKVLKDMIVRTQSLSGLDAPYRPGWDCHGLPIELQTEKTLSAERRRDPHVFRAAARAYAHKQIERQREDFVRLGVLGQWDDPYLTMDFRTEADTVRTLGALLEGGYLYRGTKPVYWCDACGSALAEAEVEYEERISPAIDVLYEAAGAGLAQAFGLAADARVGVAIWTTTPWTLIASQAVCVHPDLEYTTVEYRGAPVVVACALRESFCERTGAARAADAPVRRGRELAGLLLRHPFLEREVPLLAAGHVSDEEGTGCVHTAPAHGPEDFAVGREHALPTDSPVGADGRFGADVPEVAGLAREEATEHILELLRANDRLLARREHPHSYPHCWRHHTPLFYRTAAQWFVPMDGQTGLRAAALRTVPDVSWHPHWGEERMRGMLENRPDWCVSRHRNWGTPIALFLHRESEQPHPRSAELIEEVARRIEERGIDAWFDLEPEELLGAEAGDYVKSADTLDVWFDSGSTHHTVLDRDPQLGRPADLYLEGSDQHRGWFQSSLLVSVALTGEAPYRAVLTHGFVTDAQGHKMSKSRGNVVEPQEVIREMGADVLRLWIASSDTSSELVLSDEVLARTRESYRRIRNTARYLLGNLYDFDPGQHCVPADEMPALEQWVLGVAADCDRAVRAAYRDYHFHLAAKRLHGLCAVELGSLYLDITKDRSYTLPCAHPARRATQTAMYVLAETLARWLAPICPYTADEIYEQIPGPREDSVHLAQWFDLDPWQPAAPAFSKAQWQQMLDVRSAVDRELERMRADGGIGSPLDAEVTLTLPAEEAALFGTMGEEAHHLFLTSAVHLREGQERDITVAPSKHPKCVRCWHHHPSVGQLVDHPTLCVRCHGNIGNSPEVRLYV